MSRFSLLLTPITAEAAALAVFNQMIVDSLTVLPVTGGQFRTAVRFVDQRLGDVGYRFFGKYGLISAYASPDSKAAITP